MSFRHFCSSNEYVTVIVLRGVGAPKYRVPYVGFFVSVATAGPTADFVDNVQVGSGFRSSLVRMVNRVFSTSQRLYFVGLSVAINSPFERLPGIVSVGVDVPRVARSIFCRYVYDLRR